jgi:hypothetical protein
MKHALTAFVGAAFTLYAAGTIAAHTTGLQDTPVPEYQLAPCEHVIMMSAPMDDGSVMAYCEGSEFFTFDPDDRQWYHMSIVPVRGHGFIPVRDDQAVVLQRHANVIGDQRAVGVYE